MAGRRPSRCTPAGLAAQPVPLGPCRAERAFQLAEQLGSVNAAAADLGDHLDVAAKPSPATGLACRPASPKPSAQRAIDAVCKRSGRSAIRCWTWCLWRSTMALPAREWSPIQLYQWIGRDAANEPALDRPLCPV
jgi:hypothetical protein